MQTLALILKYDTISLLFYIFSTSPVFRYCPVGLLPFSGVQDQSYRWPVLMGTQLHVSGWNTGRLQKLSPYKQKIINAQLCMQGLDRLVRNDKNWINCKWVYCYLVHISERCAQLSWEKLCELEWCNNFAVSVSVSIPPGIFWSRFFNL